MKYIFTLFFISINCFAHGGNTIYYKPGNNSSVGVHVDNSLGEGLNIFGNGIQNPSINKSEKDLQHAHNVGISLNKEKERIEQSVQNNRATSNDIKPYKVEYKKEIVQLKSIPDPVSIPYSFKTNDKELQSIYKDLYKVTPKFGKQIKAREYGLISVEEADKLYSVGDDEFGDFYKNLAVGFLDIAVGIDPVTGVGRSAYELFIGRNLITGIPLNKYERSFAFLGVVTAGQARNISKAATGLLTIANRVSHLAPELNNIKHVLNEGQQIAHTVGDIITKGWRKSHKIVTVHTAEDINTLFRLKNPNFEDAFERSTKVVEFITTKETKFVRVFQETNVKSGWMMKYEAIKGLTAQQIQKKFYLPSLPLNIVDVHVPINYPMYRGHVAEISRFTKEGAEGAIQYFSKEFLPDASFKNIRKIEGIVK